MSSRNRIAKRIFPDGLPFLSDALVFYAMIRDQSSPVVVWAPVMVYPLPAVSKSTVWSVDCPMPSRGTRLSRALSMNRFITWSSVDRRELSFGHFHYGKGTGQGWQMAFRGAQACREWLQKLTRGNYNHS